MNPECSICFEHIENNDIFHTGVCLHIYHNRCMCLWSQNCVNKKLTCPMCRNVVPKPFASKLYKYRSLREKIDPILKTSHEMLLYGITCYIIYIRNMFYNKIAKNILEYVSNDIRVIFKLLKIKQSIFKIISGISNIRRIRRNRNRFLVQ
jgi:glucose-6-phosphate 1-dehydrogenase